MDKKVKKLLKDLKSSGGFTITKNLNKIKQKTGYCVSITSNIIDEDNFKNEIIKLTKDKDNYYIGAWIDNNKIYLDKTLIIKDMNKALKIGKEYKQKALYDLKENKVIEL